jgi:exosortase
MSSDPLAASIEDARPDEWRRWFQAWPLIVGFAILAGPTLASLGKQVWSRESGAHGPIILATGGWVLWRALDAARHQAKPGAAWLTGLLLAAGLVLYAFGRAFDFISLEAAGLYGVGVAMLHSRLGMQTILSNWFPFFYLSFAVPPPQWLIDQLTAPLKQFVSWISTESLHAVGLPIAREGVTIYVAQYQLLVEDACSGMNSLIGLAAISLLYIYLLRGSSVRYSIILTLFVIPIAVVGNIIRIMTLILLTYFFGDEVAQGFLHYTAGLFLFAVDLLLVFAFDNLLARTLPRAWRPA